MKIRLSEFAKNVTIKPILESEASEQAKMLGLRSIGWGRWVDGRGRHVANTKNGKLVKVDTVFPSPEDQAGDEDDPNMIHVNPFDSGEELGTDKYSYEPGKGFREKDSGREYFYSSENPDSQKVGQFIGKLKASGTEYHPRKGFYNAKEPLPNWTKWRDGRQSAVHSFVEKNGGAVNSLQRVSLAAVDAYRNGDDNDKWRAANIAKKFREDLRNVAMDISHELDEWAKGREGLTDQESEFVNLLEELAETSTHDAWDDDIEPSTYAEYYDVANKLMNWTPSRPPSMGDAMSASEDTEFMEQMASVIEKMRDEVTTAARNREGEDDSRGYYGRWY
jgi:hypothetical protein